MSTVGALSSPPSSSLEMSWAASVAKTVPPPELPSSDFVAPTVTRASRSSCDIGGSDASRIVRSSARPESHMVTSYVRIRVVARRSRYGLIRPGSSNRTTAFSRTNRLRRNVTRPSCVSTVPRIVGCATVPRSASVPPPRTCACGERTTRLSSRWTWTCSASSRPHSAGSARPPVLSRSGRIERSRV